MSKSKYSYKDVREWVSERNREHKLGQLPASLSVDIDLFCWLALYAHFDDIITARNGKLWFRDTPILEKQKVPA